MPNPKRPRDPNQLAKFILDVATGEAALPTSEKTSARKVASSKGGMKGGKSRMDALSAEDRVKLAQHAAATRWNKGAPAKAGAPVKPSVKSER
ncbi:hypothetical protein B0E48_07795 [Rhodanobacter sp. C03]|nr:hypothetical protein B0E48_07795 [Rhodanobacter sp. C03]